MTAKRPITQGEVARIMSFKGSMSASAAGRLMNRDNTTIGQIWRGKLFARVKPTDDNAPALSVRQEVVLGTIMAAGKTGAPMEAILAALGRAGFSTNSEAARGGISHLNERLRAASDMRRVVNLAGRGERAMYALVQRKPEPPVAPVVVRSEPTHGWPVMQINGVSLRRMSFLDRAHP